MQTPQRFKKQITHTAQLDYLLFLPEGYKKTGDKWPLMMFLHGVGERGTNVDKVATHGPPKLGEERQDRSSHLCSFRRNARATASGAMTNYSRCSIVIAKHNVERTEFISPG